MSEVILFDSPEAAKFVTGISGWVDSKGVFYGDDEKAARYSGCTHNKCNKCGEPTPKYRVYCDLCNDEFQTEKYNRLERVEWDEKTPIYSDSEDEFFSSFDDLGDFINEHECSIESLRLKLCEPVYLTGVDEDFWSDELCEDDSLPKSVVEALNHLNEVISKQPPVSWEPGNKAVLINMENINENVQY